MKSLCNTNLQWKLWIALFRMFLGTKSLLVASQSSLVVTSIGPYLWSKGVQGIRYWMLLSGTQGCEGMLKCFSSNRTCAWMTPQKVTCLPSIFWRLVLEKTQTLIEPSLYIQVCFVVILLILSLMPSTLALL